MRVPSRREAAAPGPTFAREVARIVRAIPAGTVMSYGEVARRAGRPAAARAVVRVLKTDEGEKLPWWRVVRADRTLAPEVAAEQSARLRAEGVTLARAPGRRR